MVASLAAEQQQAVSARDERQKRTNRLMKVSRSSHLQLPRAAAGVSQLAAMVAGRALSVVVAR